MSHLLVDFREGRTSSVRAIDWNTTRGESSSSVKLKWNYSTTHEVNELFFPVFFFKFF